MGALADQINTPQSGEHLSRELEKYITENEQPQLQDIQKLAQMSTNIYGDDRTGPLHTDNINLFQNFHKLKADIDDKVQQLKDLEAKRLEEERKALEEKMKQAELEREFANLMDQIESNHKRLNLYLGNAAQLADQINAPESGEHLAQQLDKYLTENEQPQLQDLKKLEEMSKKIYGEDRTGNLNLETATLFQGFHNLREDIEDKIRNLKAIEAQRAKEEKRALEEKLRQAELEREYQNLLDQIDAGFRRNTAYHTNAKDLAAQINTPESGEHLAREIEKHLSEHEPPQLADLKKLAEASVATYGEDRTGPVQKDNVNLFQAIHKLCGDIGAKVAELKEIEAQNAEREKKELEEKLRRADLERQYQNLLDQIESACRRHNVYFSNASTLAEQVNTPEAGEHLARELLKYLTEHEKPQLEKLRQLAVMSEAVYGEDHTEGIYLDNVGVFQALHKLSRDILERAEFLRDEEAKQQEAGRRALEEEMKKADMEREFSNLIEQIESARRRHAAYLGNVKNLIGQIKTPEAGEHLAKELQKYIDQNEQPQIDTLKRLVELSNKMYGEDRTGPVHVNNIELFQDFHKTKVQIDKKVQELREEENKRLEAERLDLEEKMRAAEAERAKIEELRRQEAEKRVTLEEQRKREQAELALLEEQRLRQEQERLALEEQKLKEKAQLLLLEQQRLKEAAECDRFEEERKRKDLEHAALEEQRRKEEAARFASYEPPTFLAPLGDATITEGDKFSFGCSVKGFPEPTIQWYKDGIAIAKDSDYKTSFENGDCRLSIEEAITADTAVFTCKASNSVGVSETAAKLFVRETSPECLSTPPMFVKPLESATAREGESFQFRCVVTGNPLPTVQWFKNDISVDNSTDFVIAYNNGEATLQFEEIFLEDQAVFKCRATNLSGFEDTFAQLTVERKYFFYF